jgi:predicted nucleic acid-binding protein
MTDQITGTLDTNIILRHLLNDHPDHSPRASGLLYRVSQGEIAVYFPDTAIFEAVYILTGLAKVPRPMVERSLISLLEPATFNMDHKSSVIGALDFWKDQPAIDFADCYYLALTEALGVTQIHTFDRKMDRYPGVDRVEP